MRRLWLALQWIAGRFADVVVMQIRISNEIQFYLDDKVRRA